jgi:hypothetical protein
MWAKTEPSYIGRPTLVGSFEELRLSLARFHTLDLDGQYACSCWVISKEDQPLTSIAAGTVLFR